MDSSFRWNDDKGGLVNLDDQLLRYFGTADLAAIPPQGLAAGIERMQVDLGLESDRSRRFALWALLHMLGAAPALDVAFKEEADRRATSSTCRINSARTELPPSALFTSVPAFALSAVRGSSRVTGDVLMRMILAGLSAALLAGCGGATIANNSGSGNAAAPVNTAVPSAPINPANMVLPGGEEDAGGPANRTANSTAAGGATGRNREALLAECTDQGRAMLPAGTDVAALCGCAVDRHLAGARRNAAMRQCAAERNVRLDR
jgi:hypothetical protein